MGWECKMAQINIKDAIVNVVEKYLKSFSKSLITKFYTKEQLMDLYDKKDLIKNLSENSNDKLLYNGSILCTEDDLINIKASNIIVETDNGEKTLQEILDSLSDYSDAPKAYCGTTECGSSYCGDIDSEDA